MKARRSAVTVSPFTIQAAADASRKCLFSGPRESHQEAARAYRIEDSHLLLSRSTLILRLVFTISWRTAGLGKLPECFCTRREWQQSAHSDQFCDSSIGHYGLEPPAAADWVNGNYAKRLNRHRPNSCPVLHSRMRSRASQSLLRNSATVPPLI